MANYLAFPNIPNMGALDIRAFMSPGDDHDENQNPRTFHRYCTPMKPHAGTECSICIENIENDYEGASLGCGCHANYHKACIFGWFRRSTNPTDQYARGELTCTLCRSTQTPNLAPFDYGANPDEYIEPVGGNTQVARSLFGGDGDNSDDDIQVILPSN